MKVIRPAEAAVSIFRSSGDGEIRTHDPLLARQMLSQLSYTPRFILIGFSFFIYSGSHLLSHAVSNIVPSAAQALTFVFGMCTGVSPERIATGNFRVTLVSAHLTDS